MPIDWDMIARAFRVPLRFQMRAMTLVFERLEEMLKLRVERAEKLEEAARGFPVLRFYNGALSMYVGQHQHGTILSAPGFGATLRSAGGAFVTGVGQLRTSVAESLALPRLLDALESGLTTVAGSVDRFAVPGRHLFETDPGKRRASDVFGIAALGFTSIASSLLPLARARLRVAIAGDILARTFPESTTSRKGPERVLPEGPGERLDLIARYLLGGVLLVPMLTDLIGEMMNQASLRGQQLVLEQLDDIEKSVFGMRRDVLELFYADLPAYTDWALGITHLFNRAVVTQNLNFLIAFSETFLGELLVQISTLSGDLQHYVNFAMGFGYTVLGALDAFMDTDITFIMRAVQFMFQSPPTFVKRLIQGKPFRLRSLIQDPKQVKEMRDLLVKGAGHARKVLKKGQGLILGPVISWVWDPTEGIRHKIDLVQEIIEKTLVPYKQQAVEAELPTFKSDFPDLARDLGLTSAELRTNVTDLRDAVQRGVHDLFGAGIGAIDAGASAFDAAGTRAALLGSDAALRKQSAEAGRLAGFALGDQVAELQREQALAVDPVAKSLEDWLGSVGFQVIGAAIPVFVAEMDAYRREQLAAHEEPGVFLEVKEDDKGMPTSPHILAARRAQLRRVQLGEVRVTAKGRALDQGLVDEIVARFVVDMDKAYKSGIAGLREMHGQAIREAKEAARKKKPPGKHGPAHRAKPHKAPAGAP